MRVLTRKEFQDDVAKMWSEAVEAEYKDLIEKAVLAEREACAKICDAEQKKNEDNGQWLWEAKTCGIAIRARGQA